MRLAHCGIHIRNLKGIHLYKPLVKHPQLLNFNRKSIGSLFFPVFVRKFAFLWTGLLFKVVFNANKESPLLKKDEKLSLVSPIGKVGFFFAKKILKLKSRQSVLRATQPPSAPMQNKTPIQRKARIWHHFKDASPWALWFQNIVF